MFTIIIRLNVINYTIVHKCTSIHLNVIQIQRLTNFPSNVMKNVVF